jgi:hypothetical protein
VFRTRGAADEAVETAEAAGVDVRAGEGALDAGAPTPNVNPPNAVPELDTGAVLPGVDTAEGWATDLTPNVKFPNTEVEEEDGAPEATGAPCPNVKPPKAAAGAGADELAVGAAPVVAAPPLGPTVPQHGHSVSLALLCTRHSEHCQPPGGACPQMEGVAAGTDEGCDFPSSASDSDSDSDSDSEDDPSSELEPPPLPDADAATAGLLGAALVAAVAGAPKLNPANGVDLTAGAAAVGAAATPNENPAEGAPRVLNVPDAPTPNVKPPKAGAGAAAAAADKLAVDTATATGAAATVEPLPFGPAVPQHGHSVSLALLCTRHSEHCQPPGGACPQMEGVAAGTDDGCAFPSPASDSDSDSDWEVDPSSELEASPLTGADGAAVALLGPALVAALAGAPKLNPANGADVAAGTVLEVAGAEVPLAVPATPNVKPPKVPPAAGAGAAPAPKEDAAGAGPTVGAPATDAGEVVAAAVTGATLVAAAVTSFLLGAGTCGAMYVGGSKPHSATTTANPGKGAWPDEGSTLTACAIRSSTRAPDTTRANTARVEVSQAGWGTRQRVMPGCPGVRDRQPRSCRTRELLVEAGAGLAVARATL